MQRMREELEDEVRVKRDLADLQQQFLVESGQKKEKPTVTDDSLKVPANPEIHHRENHLSDPNNSLLGGKGFD